MNNLNMSNLNIEYKNIINNNNNLNITIPKNIEDTINNFLKNIDSKYHSIYCKNIDNIYYNIFNNLELYSFLLDCVDDAFKILMHQNNYLLNNSNLWKIFIYNNMMFELPFTLDDIIFIPASYIISCFKSNNNLKFTKTLIHERIHVSQRYNIDVWNQFIFNNDKNWIKINSDNIIFSSIQNYDFSSLFNKNIIVNPDVCYPDFKYIYSYNNNLYYGMFLLDNNNITNKWVKIILSNNNVTFQINNDSFLNSLLGEHPFEVYAYSISDDYI